MHRGRVTTIVFGLGFISIRRYRNIDRGISDLAIIVAPIDWTISCTNACLTAQQLTPNSQGDKDSHWMLPERP